MQEHVTSSGRFTTSYTFGAGDPGVRRPHWFEIACLPMGDYPFAPGHSRRRSVIHALPATGPLALRDQLLRNAATNSAVALSCCHQAVELDGQAHDYSAHQWLPVVYDIAGPLLEEARLNREPPSVVEQAQEAVRWLSRAIVDLDEDSPDAAAALVDGLGRLLALHVFAEVAREPTNQHQARRRRTLGRQGSHPPKHAS